MKRDTEKRVVRAVKIDLPISWLDGWRLVKAEIVDVAPHLAHIATFSVLRSPWSNLWNVTNVETGDYCWRHYATRRQAILGTRDRLKTITVSKMTSCLAKHSLGKRRRK